MPMRFAIDASSDVPIYSQIVEQVKRAIATGAAVPGGRLPTIRKLAAELNVHANTVARAYVEMERTGIVVTRPGLGTFITLRGDDSRLTAEREARLMGIVARMATEALSLGYSVEQVEAALVLGLVQWQPGPCAVDDSQKGEMEGALPLDKVVVTGSNDITLDLLVGRLRGRLGIDVSGTHIGSLAGLISLAKGEAHVAGCHLFDEETGQYNLPYVRRLLPGQGVVLVNLAYRLQGFIVRRGNPRGIKRIDDLARRDILFVNRQKGSGTRVMLDCKLRDAGVERETVRGYGREESTHIAVAAAVSSGDADVGLGIMAVARALELDFIPLWRERYDLVVPRQHYNSPFLQPLLEAVRDKGFQHVVEQIGGYQTTETGHVVGET